MPRVHAALDAVQQALSAGNALGARSHLQRALRQSPNDPDLNTAMARVLIHLKERDAAVYYAERACRTRPGDNESVTAFSWAVSIGRTPLEVAAHLEKQIGKSPDDASLRFAIADAYLALGRPTAAARHALEGVRAQPGHVPLVVKGLAALHQSSQVPELIALARAVLARSPDEPNTAFSLSFEVNYADPPDPAVVLADQKRAASIIERNVVPARGLFKNTPDPDRPLRVGLLSPDLRRHSVAYFLEPLLRCRDPRTLEVWCYATLNARDETSERLKTLASGWREVEQVDDAALADLIRSDVIDLLVDLSGHTRGHRLPVFVHAPAPLTATFIGYPATTGMESIAVRFVDSLTDPEGAERWCVERLVRLDPCFLCYQPPADAPDPVPAPHTLPGATGITFGSFNTLSKVSGSVVRAWTQVLTRVAGSRLVLKAPQFGDPDVRERTLGRFAEAGLDPARVTIIERVRGPAAHLAQYAMIDIALDSFPYCGTTTTCEALWMGVPVVTVGGPTHSSRVGVSLLTNAGLPELIARDQDEYVSMAAALAVDRERLCGLRAGLRERLARSALCDGPAYAGRFESAVRLLWREHLSGRRLGA